MADRPCKPGADLKLIWRMLLPGTQFPTCGIPEDFEAARRDIEEFEAASPEGTTAKLPKP